MRASSRGLFQEQHFDPHHTTPDRPDRLLKTRELATLLAFYRERSVRKIRSL